MIINNLIVFDFNVYTLSAAALIVSVGGVVGLFSIEYLKGDKLYPKFFSLIGLLVMSALWVVLTDNIFILPCAWLMSNLALTHLMAHKKSWKASLHAAQYAQRILLFGTLCLAAACTLLYRETGSFLISDILHVSLSKEINYGAILLITLAAMAQSAIWPFHKWLLSSLNSPTSVSALMHAGLVNAGGFLLLKFVPLFAQFPIVFNVIFVVGLFTAAAGTCWKLVQPNVKSMLACSTMGQMGFMFVQFGLGIFPGVLSHIICHGFFKAYLFLSSGNAAKEKRVGATPHLSLIHVFLSPCLGALGLSAFLFVSKQSLFATLPQAFMQWLVILLCIQYSLSMVTDTSAKSFVTGGLGAFITGLIYGGVMLTLSTYYDGLYPSIALENTWLYWGGLGGLTALWLVIPMGVLKPSFYNSSKWISRIYVRALSQSQPAPQTMTPVRSDYKYN